MIQSAGVGKMKVTPSKNAQEKNKNLRLTQHNVLPSSNMSHWSITYNNFKHSNLVYYFIKSAFKCISLFL